METEVQNIVSLLARTFEKDAWHGPSVKEALENISEDIAFNRLPDTHSIIELVAHMTAWRTYVIQKLKGDAAFKITDEGNFPNVSDWDGAVKRLEDSQAQLMAELKKLSASRLNDLVPGRAKPLSFYDLLHGIIHHDLYHAGQIVLINKATAKQSF